MFAAFFEFAGVSVLSRRPRTKTFNCWLSIDKSTQPLITRPIETLLIETFAFLWLGLRRACILRVLTGMGYCYVFGEARNAITDLYTS